MYLLPAISGKAFGLRAADLALLIQNSLLLTLIFGLGSMLFTTSRARARALVIVIFFSGMDVIGQLLQWHVNGHPFPDHIEQRSEEHTSELQSLMRISYAVFFLKKNNN